MNRLIAETNALSATRSFSYDPVGNSTAIRDRNGRVRTFSYDALNRQTLEQWLSTTGTPIQTITSTYDDASQLTAVGDSNSTLSFTYDLNGRRKTVNNTGTPGVPNVLLSYTYSDIGKVLSVNDTINGLPKGITAYTYDQLNRTTQITQTGNGVSNKRVDFTYDAIGQSKSINRYADLVGTQLVVGTNYTYDTLNRLANKTHSNITSGVAFYNFNYDPASRITKITDVDGVTNYTHDNTNQLLGANHTAPTNPDESYSYDANGNRLSNNTGANNRLLSDGTYNYTYDFEGNLLLQTEIATGAFTEYTWDYRNRLVAVTNRNAALSVTQTVTYTYDAMNNRIAKAVDTNPLDAISPSVTHFVYDRDNVLLEFVDADGTSGPLAPELDTRYLHSPQTDQVLAQQDTTGVFWHLSDHLGTVRDLVNNSGAVVNHLTYDSFGNGISQTNPAIDTRYLFTGREFDKETGQYYYRSRYYAPVIGRFLGEDSLGFESGDSNFYTYIFNRPLDAVDPSGQAGRLLTQTRTIRYEVQGKVETTNDMKWVEKDLVQLRLSKPNPDIPILFDETHASIIRGGGGTGSASMPYGNKPGSDQQGHIVPKLLGGRGSRNNMFAQDKLVNEIDYKAFAKVVDDELGKRPYISRKCPRIHTKLDYYVNMNYNLNKIKANPIHSQFPLRPTSFQATAQIPFLGWEYGRGFYNPI